MNQLTQTLNLFALTNIPGMRVLRMPLTPDVQAGISELFRAQEHEFMQGIEEEIKFDGMYRPEESEILYINNFDDVDGIKSAILRPQTCQEFSLKSGALESIKAVFSGYIKNGVIRVLLQGFDRRRIINASGFSLVYSENSFARFDGGGLTLDNKLTAIIEDDNLKFASYHYLRQMFDMSAYCKEASDQDLKVFIQNQALQFADAQVFMDVADSWVRRKVVLIQQSGILDHCAASKIAATAKFCDLHLQLSGVAGQEKIVIPADRQEVKQILRFLDEDYFQSPQSTMKYMAKSRRVMDRY
ncbi:MAG: hypothetical protein B7Y56_04315 [Gallionellales bacterium 35-53-114]|jgi:hypothetical protein|nr:MAG: hypothetical protein B7Y56_04315 [Gallionellales bacterium 35-53-114]OYZ65317.1 MAG: hypothetical protein B7Y04_01470 [Gallionellales bacterium 24-53-125]OZB08224.1 MAG: hypothetical protein B7X61_11925 [Gallionellales bacterium 39-52-133]HQS58154.1 hypothetical protein [Gallionellaceae bacterium]HQS73709.1 hypothetical protein [Gallionellaceae bacterium]